jgi:prophage DNA circulation protein
MTIDQRIEALTTHLELLSQDREHDRLLINELREGLTELRGTVNALQASVSELYGTVNVLQATVSGLTDGLRITATTVADLARVAVRHEARLDKIEG